ncbi:MAG: protein TolQ [Ectothiorhodospiraceae bacterium]|nr:protein TolQ [Ectothiorhodospiraceae bacterium]
MTTDLSLLTLVRDASFLVQLVMLVLLVASLVCWTMIFAKRSALARARRAADEFEEQFWSGQDLVTIYNRVAKPDYPASGLERIFRSGFKEFAKLRNQGGMEPAVILEGTQRAMRVALNRELDELESNLSFLATVGSTSPYVGLFGTVWGIMNSFRALGDIAQATLAHVAPGIAEALIATAMGLFAAIPAVIAYNRFANNVERLYSRYDNFIEEFSAILQRQAHN